MSDKRHDKRKEHQPASHDAQPANHCEIKWPTVYPVRIEPAPGDAQKYASEQLYKKKQLRLARCLNFITAGAAVVGLFGLGFLYTQINVMRGQLSEARDEMRLSERPWIGIADEPKAFDVGPITFDEIGNAKVDYSIKMRNFSNSAAQNIVPNAFLLITEDLKFVTQKREESCNERYVGHSQRDMGYLLFPGRERVLQESSSVFPRSDMTSAGWNGKFEAYVVGCIGYRDQFGYLYHTSFTYWLVDPATYRPIEFSVVPNSKIASGSFDIWHSGHFVDLGAPPKAN